MASQTLAEKHARSQAEIHARHVCMLLGVEFVGIQQMYDLRPDQVLFQPTKGILKGSTLAVPVLSTPWAFIEKLADAEFAATKIPSAA